MTTRKNCNIDGNDDDANNDGNDTNDNNDGAKTMATTPTSVCMDPFSPQEPALLLSQCQGHYMHAPCIMQVFMAMGPKCPTCSKMYGALHGEKTHTHTP